jgi:hypothetical protein
MVINRVKELLGKKPNVEPYGAPAPPPEADGPQPAPAAAAPVPARHEPAREPRQLVSLDDYFDQLDAAFSNIQPDAGNGSGVGIDMDWIEPDAPVEPAAPAAPVAPVAPPPAAIITDDVIEEIAKRVLERLSDKVVRETVSGIVGQTAERLVKEEIDRIKSGQ